MDAAPSFFSTASVLSFVVRLDSGALDDESEDKWPEVLEFKDKPLKALGTPSSESSHK